MVAFAQVLYERYLAQRWLPATRYLVHRKQLEIKRRHKELGLPHAHDFTSIESCGGTQGLLQIILEETRSVIDDNVGSLSEFGPSKREPML